MELVDMLDLGSSVERRTGSNPVIGTRLFEYVIKLNILTLIILIKKKQGWAHTKVQRSAKIVYRNPVRCSIYSE